MKKTDQCQQKKFMCLITMSKKMNFKKFIALKQGENQEEENCESQKKEELPEEFFEYK